MKKKLVLKPFVLPTLYVLMVVILMFLSTRMLYQEEEEDINYVSDTILDNTMPVVNEEKIFVLTPFNSEKVVVKIGYYNYQEQEQNQENSIVKYDDTYLQNSGITYVGDEVFDVLSIMDGKVTKIYQNELLGNIIEVTHENNMISVYQMLSEINVKVDQQLKAGDVIAKSGKSKLSPGENNLHFEIIKDGIVINPNEVIGKNIKELK